MDNNIVDEWILHSIFKVFERTKSLQCLESHLSTRVKPCNNVLNLCCGSRPMSFWFEEQGTNTAGIDFVSYMSALAKDIWPEFCA